MLSTDFCWYWGHRASHRINLFVATHDVHHQASDFNHASALRQSWSSRIFMFLFFIPMALLGVPFEVGLICQIVNGALQFLTHNGVYLSPIPWIEKIFVIPRTHYVHHGINKPYMDKNFGGVLILWDRFFGTYQDIDEKIPVIIGSKDTKEELDPIKANLKYFKDIFQVMKNEHSLWSKFMVLWKSPEYLADQLRTIKKDSSGVPLVSINFQIKGSFSKDHFFFWWPLILSILLMLLLMLYWVQETWPLRISLATLNIYVLRIAYKKLYNFHLVRSPSLAASSACAPYRK